MSSGRWVKGQSGNPKGRPLKSRALTEILAKGGSRTHEDIDGKRRSGKHILKRLIWDLAVTGTTKLPGGREIVAGYSDWWETVKWLFVHIDGPPRAAMDLDVTTGGKTLDALFEQALEKVYQGGDDAPGGDNADGDS